MIKSRKSMRAFIVSLAIVSTCVFIPINQTTVSNSKISTVYADETITIDSLPTEYKESMDWIWENRILDEKSTERWNLIYDQIIAGNGTLNYVVRWQSSTALTYEQRQKFQPMIERQINAWTDWLVDFEDWPFSHVNVNIVGWAVSDESLILDKQDDEVIYTTCTTDTLHNDNPEVPELLPCAPSENSRADHYYETDYVYPDTRFDMYLWGTTSFQGGAGGDWGQRMSDDYILSVLDSQDAHVIEHEIGHGFGMTDFYEENQCPTWPDGSSNIMVAGWAMNVTDYDGWMLRYIWNKIKDEKNSSGISRFNLSQVEIDTTTTTTTIETSTTEPTVTTSTTDDNIWTFNITDNTNTVLDVSVRGEAYSGVAGIYYCLDNNGNVIFQDNWLLSNSLGEDGIESFSVSIPSDTAILKVEVSTYFVWDSNLGDNKDLDINTLDISLENIQNTEPIETTTIDPVEVRPILDILELKKYLLGISSNIDTSYFDVNNDNTINSLDLVTLKSYLL